MFQTGDEVIDRESMEPDIMRVINPKIGVAADTQITELEKTVHQANPDYPAWDDVVETVYESWLDAYVPQWKEWPTRQLADKLRDYAEIWSISLKTYYYPQSRLKVVNVSNET